MASLVEKINGAGVYISRGIHVIDNLLSTSSISPLSAKQGKVLDEKISETNSEIESVDAKVGDAEDLPNPLLSTNENVAELNANLVALYNKFNYSTNEEVIGTWIDGKPIYRKVINFSTPISVSSAWSEVATINNIGNVIQPSYFIGWTSSMADYSTRPCYYKASNNKLYIWAIAGGYVDKIIIEYTKTID